MRVIDWLASLFRDNNEVSQEGLEWLASAQYLDYWETYRKFLPYKTDSSKPC